MRRAWVIRWVVLGLVAGGAAGWGGPVRAGEDPEPEEPSELLPSEGLDLVRLDDGRTLRCRAGPRVNGVHLLEFPEVSLEVPAARIERILHFRDFDPEPRDDAERARVARGLVRWAGQWYTPSRAAELRARFLEKEKDDWFDSLPVEDWEDRNEVETAEFLIESDLPMKRILRYDDLLHEYLKSLRAHLQLPLPEFSSPVRILIFKDAAGFAAAAREDRVRGEHTIGYYKPGRELEKGHLVLFDLPGEPDRTLDVLLHEATHLFLDAATGRTFDPVRPWLNEGLAEYMGGSEWRYGKFRPGALQEERLLHFKEMIEEGRVVPLDDLVRIVRWDPEPEEDAVRVPFGLDHYAQSWCFVHFLLHGRQTAYRGAFRDYLKLHKFHQRDGLAYLLSRLQRKDFRVIQDQLVDYARGLELTGGRAHARRALLRAAEGREKEAEADLAVAVARAGEDRPTLALAGRAALVLGKPVLAADLLERYLALDPLDSRARLARSWCLKGEAALREARLAAALSPDDEEVADQAARRMHAVVAGDRGNLLDPGAITREAETLATGSAPGVVLDPGPVLRAYAALKEGDLERARTLLAEVGEPEDPRVAGMAAGLEAVLGDGEALARRLAAYRTAARAAPAVAGEPPARERIAMAVAIAAGLSMESGHREECGRGLDLLYRDEDPATEEEWGVWATAVLDPADPRRARAILSMGLRAFPQSRALRECRDALPEEIR